MKLFSLLALLLLSACATGPKPFPSERMGLFSKGQLSRVQRAPAGEVSVPDKNIQFQWPLKKVQVTSPFGERGKEYHEGIDLRAKAGTPVYSAAAGVVIYAAKRIRGYGRMVVIRHPNGLATVYAHNSRLSVVEGQRVKGGQQIAFTGKTGHARGPHLHFEVRNGSRAMDPQSLLPKPGLNVVTHSPLKRTLQGEDRHT